jgi:hypothetical protein
MALGVPPVPIAPINPYGVSPFGMPLGAFPQVPMPGIVPPTPIGPSAVSPFGTQLGTPLGATPQAPIPAFGTPLGVPQAPIGPINPYGLLPPPSPSATVVPFLVSQIALREAANRLGDDAVKARVITGANEAIERTIEDVAGVTLPPWLKTMAPAWVYPTAVDLAMLAHSYPEGPVRGELLNVAGQILSKGLAPMGEGQSGSHRR